MTKARQSVRMRVLRAAIGAAAFGMFAPAQAQLVTSDTSTTETEDIVVDVSKGSTLSYTPDPWEKLNRTTFAIHNAVDEVVLIPIARGYRAVTTKQMRRSVRNAVRNARSPVIFANDLLQGEPKRAGKTLGRFLLNTIFGFGGLLDPAAIEGLEPHNEDFGQTLAVWGVPSGPYIFVPLFGPTTLRDGVGLAVDRSFDPLTYFNESPFGIVKGARTGVNGVSAREWALDPVETIKESSLDYYTSFRSFYSQARRREILNGRVDIDDLPDIGDFEAPDDFEGFDEFDDFSDTSAPETDAQTETPESPEN